MSVRPKSGEQPRTLVLLRAALLVILVIGLVGTGVELLLLEHTEDLWQWAPLILIALSLLILAWHAIRRGPKTIRALQIVMVLCVVSGLVGVLLHYQGNVEFELEMYPSLTGIELFRQAMSGATPALAPGTMLHLGLLGLAYTYRHPSLTRAADESRDMGS
ncbi:MAG TPA: hypothetical protein VJ596_03445 [Gemmatimonadaceae bacterium]|nr:hypothetical protein [Gemmatimonadaceae bacterium]